MRLIEHLWVHGEPPPEYIEYQLCRLWHCPPTALEGISLRTALAHLTCAATEREVGAWLQRLKSK